MPDPYGPDPDNVFWIAAIDDILADLDIDLTAEQIDAIAAKVRDVVDGRDGAVGFSTYRQPVRAAVAARDDSAAAHAAVAADASARGIPAADLYGLRDISTPCWGPR
jgi:hypothetical protein